MRYVVEVMAIHSRECSPPSKKTFLALFPVVLSLAAPFPPRVIPSTFMGRPSYELPMSYTLAIYFEDN